MAPAPALQGRVEFAVVDDDEGDGCPVGARLEVAHRDFEAPLPGAVAEAPGEALGAAHREFLRRSCDGGVGREREAQVFSCALFQNAPGVDAPPRLALVQVDPAKQASRRALRCAVVEGRRPAQGVLPAVPLA